MSAGPLSGHCIVTTRPADQAHGLEQALQSLGAKVINFPVIGIVAADPAPLQDLLLNQYAMAFFVSPNAVAHSLTIRPQQEWPGHIRVAGVGPATCQALESQGFANVIHPATRFDSEGVLALPEFSREAVTGRKILIMRGNGGRELIAETLRERGAEVTLLSCYRRIRATLDPLPLIRRFHAGELSALVFSASQGVTFFLEIMGDSGIGMLRQLPVFAPHPRICEALRLAGAHTPTLTPASDKGIADGIVQAMGGPSIQLPA